MNDSLDFNKTYVPYAFWKWRDALDKIIDQCIQDMRIFDKYFQYDLDYDKRSNDIRTATFVKPCLVTLRGHLFNYLTHLIDFTGEDYDTQHTAELRKCKFYVHAMLRDLEKLLMEWEEQIWQKPMEGFNFLQDILVHFEKRLISFKADIRNNIFESK
jgi:hypothetical protein